MLPLVASLIVFFAIFLTVYGLMRSNTDIRSTAGIGEKGIGTSVSEENSMRIRITQPSPNETLSNPVIIKVDGAPDGITKVQFWNDDATEPLNEVFEAPYETSVTLPAGRHRIHAVGFDMDGNALRSQIVPVLVQ